MYRYSRRLAWNVSVNALSEEARERQLQGERIIDLTSANPTVVFDDYPHLDIGRAFAEVADFRYTPDPLGGAAARNAICAYYKERGIPASPGQLILTASTSEAYALLFKMLCDPNDEVLVPRPSYPLFEFLAHLECVCVQHYRLDYDGAWYIDVDDLRKRIGERTRAIVVVNPNNPTGSFLKQREFEGLCEIASTNGVPIICDEVFLDYAFDSSTDNVKTLIGRNAVLSFSLNGLSKAAGMPQMKLGWISINGRDAECRLARERLELISDTYLSVGTPIQKALPRLFEIGARVQRSIVQRTRMNLAAAVEILRNGAARALHCAGGWSIIVRLPATQSEESWSLRLLHDCGILVHPGYFFDMASEPYVVASLLSKPEDFARGISRLHELANLQ